MLPFPIEGRLKNNNTNLEQFHIDSSPLKVLKFCKMRRCCFLSATTRDSAHPFFLGNQPLCNVTSGTVLFIFFCFLTNGVEQLVGGGCFQQAANRGLTVASSLSGKAGQRLSVYVPETAGELLKKKKSPLFYWKALNSLLPQQTVM